MNNHIANLSSLRYASKHGKSYPVIKTTAETSRFRLEREAKKAEREQLAKDKRK